MITYITALLVLFPILASVIVSQVRGEQVKKLALLFSLVELGLSIIALSKFDYTNPDSQFIYDKTWVDSLGIHFKVGMDGISLLLILLTTVLTPLIILSSFRKEFRKPHALYALVLFMQAGLIGVFTSLDAFLFYVAWEAALIPIYFISAIWGGEDRIRVTFKFFVYTMFGSLFMLIGIIYLYLHTPGTAQYIHSFDINQFYQVAADRGSQSWLFWCFFLAFAIKMPVFPFHTWQPDTYTTAPTIGTMLLSGIMLKMGVYGVMRWLLPVLPLGVMEWGKTALILSIIGVVYASIIAFTQKDIKRLIAYSSIAHVGLISAGLFTGNVQGMQGAMIQMVSHGINVVGLFFIVEIIFDRTKARENYLLGGIASSAPQLAATFLIIILGAVALPLTNGFVGEFLLLNSVYEYNVWYAAVAGLTIIFGAVYMFRMYQNVMLGPANSTTANVTDLIGSEKIVLYVICAMVIYFGFQPKYILHISEASVNNLLEIIRLKMQ
ncbi:complex I subunit 4 family protein [Solitalea canadensis]|uniref:Proton-translocating NADH-quinone oxidoreductase, chain M n=1 Tax=Solitalea canadensis (strain ATCC 29591 / DSM 3403 / JCM 21819 / LMG 8368 / NBRC 15130 / NCIMB 12057 / USAM 9D) TaxID=929556 RepID=H8KMD3_SOLCM|nr:NADH-quinone oxidoreductase subunit M [Solitalea canadensis]AFD08728.1 proton-translocating NADH-quinone oxidoreductase, chain M [Solitalea canadensis DSM 3403]